MKSIFYRVPAAVLILALLMSGCATFRVQSVAHGNDSCEDLCGKTPQVYGGTVEALRFALYPALCKSGDEEDGLSLLIAYPLFLPFLAVDLALSIAADTVLLPYTVYKQNKTGNICPSRDYR